VVDKFHRWDWTYINKIWNIYWLNTNQVRNVYGFNIGFILKQYTVCSILYLNILINILLEYWTYSSRQPRTYIRHRSDTCRTDFGRNAKIAQQGPCVPGKKCEKNVSYKGYWARTTFSFFSETSLLFVRNYYFQRTCAFAVSLYS